MEEHENNCIYTLKWTLLLSLFLCLSLFCNIFYGNKFRELLGWNLFYAILEQEKSGAAQNLSAPRRVSPSDTSKSSQDQSLDARNGKVFQVRGAREQER